MLAKFNYFHCTLSTLSIASSSVDLTTKATSKAPADLVSVVTDSPLPFPHQHRSGSTQPGT